MRDQLGGFSLRKPVLWLDIDGTVRHSVEQLGRFVKIAADVVVFREVPQLLRAYKDAGWRIVGVSNQGGVALGHLTVHDVYANMNETMRQCGGHFDRIGFCCHHPDANEAEMACCWCRKPRIGLLVELGLNLAAQHGECYPPHMGLFVGDRPEDAQCASNAGLRFMEAIAWRQLDPAHAGRSGDITRADRR